MTFECNGVRRDTADLIGFETGDHDTPFVYMTRDRTCVLVGTLDNWNARMRPSDASEVGFP